MVESCEQCIYWRDCPCGYSLHNAACFVISKKSEPEQK